MGKFSAGIQKAGKVNNHKRGAPRKIELRRQIMQSMTQMGAPVRVLDCFAGAGVMYRQAWHDAESYVGCDMTWKPWFTHKAFCTDNRRLLRAIDLAPFTVFDLDAYGSPWEQAMILAARRKLQPGEVVALALTDGSSMRARMGAVTRHLAELAGVAVSLKGAQREWTALTAKALEAVAAQMGGVVVEHWQAETDGRSMVYSAAILRGAGEAQA